MKFFFLRRKGSGKKSQPKRGWGWARFYTSPALTVHANDLSPIVYIIIDLFIRNIMSFLRWSSSVGYALARVVAILHRNSREIMRRVTILTMYRVSITATVHPFVCWKIRQTEKTIKSCTVLFIVPSAAWNFEILIREDDLIHRCVMDRTYRFYNFHIWDILCYTQPLYVTVFFN